MAKIVFLGHLIANLDWFRTLGCLFYLLGIVKTIQEFKKQ